MRPASEGEPAVASWSVVLDLIFLDAAEGVKLSLSGLGADAGDVEQFGAKGALLAALAVEGDGEAVGFVANLLDEVEPGSAA